MITPRRPTRREFLLAATSALSGCAGAQSQLSPSPAPSTEPPAAPPLDFRRLPYWRGFNLLEKFSLGTDGPYQEWDFDFMLEHGFNFVRLPTDYRCWTEAPGRYRERPLAEIAQAVTWARSRGIHVNLALHRAPGYCVNQNPPEQLELWAEDAGGAQARAEFEAQWHLLAERLGDFSSHELSFNLVNEPGDVSGATYRRVVEPVVAAIRAVSADRLIVADGTSHGRKPVPELTPLGLAQSTRGYAPFQLTHYRADWVEGAGAWQEPAWPVRALLGRYLYGSEKPELKSPLVLTGEFSGDLAIHVQEVSQRARLLVFADGERVFERLLEPKGGAGEWKKSEYKPEWKIHQAVYDRAFAVRLPKVAKELRIELSDGDWLTYSEIRIGAFRVRPNDADWGKRQGSFSVDARGEVGANGAMSGVDRASLFTDNVEPWLDFSRGQGVGVHVGEWGAHRFTPHPVVLTWMRDCLSNFARAGFGWALWNLRGNFGCVDSKRAGVNYESVAGHALDRQMLEVLKATKRA